MKKIASLIMIAHHFIVMSFLDLPYLVTLFGYAYKICLAIYEVLFGNGYYFAKEKVIKYGLKKCEVITNILDIIIYTFYTCCPYKWMKNDIMEFNCIVGWIVI